MKITYEELLQEVHQEKILNVFYVAQVVEELIEADEVFDEFADENYDKSTRKKMRNLAGYFADTDLRIYGTSDVFHNCAVPYAKENMYDCACTILQRGLLEQVAAIDLLADYIRYGISCNMYDKCESYFQQLLRIPLNEWGWRAFSFSLDYLLDKLNRSSEPQDRNQLKEMAVGLADEFVKTVGTDHAYFYKATVLKSLGIVQGETEESVLQSGIDNLMIAPRCALRMADLMFEQGNYKKATELLKMCCINALKPQPDVNGGYVFLLSALSKTSLLFVEHQGNDYSDYKDVVLDIYKDFNTAIEYGLTGIYRGTANTSIKIVATQTNYEYPYHNADDPYDF